MPNSLVLVLLARVKSSFYNLSICALVWILTQTQLFPRLGAHVSQISMSLSVPQKIMVQSAERR